MQVKEATLADGGNEHIQNGKRDTRLCGKAVFFHQQIERNDTARHDDSLSDLKRQSRGEKPIKRQKQIINGRKMHRKMGKHLITLTGRNGFKAFRHIMEHLNEDTEIIGGACEGEIAEAGGDRNDRRANDAAGDSHPRRDRGRKRQGR